MSKFLKIKDCYIGILSITGYQFSGEDVVVTYGQGTDFIRVEKEHPDFQKIEELIKAMEKANLLITLDEVITVLTNIGNSAEKGEVQREQDKQMVLDSLKNLIAEKMKNKKEIN